MAEMKSKTLWNSVLIQLFGCLLFSLSLVKSVIADDSVLNFVKTYRGLYASEVKNDDLFSKTYSARSRVKPETIGIGYNDTNGLITLTSDQFHSLKYREVLESCMKTGSGVGVTAFGVRSRYTKQICHRIFLTKNDDKWMGEKWLPSGLNTNGGSSEHLMKATVSVIGSPTMYRQIKASGFDVQIVFTPIKSDGLVVEYDHGEQSPSLDYPYETDMHVYHFPATVHRIEYFLPNGKSPFHVESFD